MDRPEESLTIQLTGNFDSGLSAVCRMTTAVCTWVWQPVTLPSLFTVLVWFLKFLHTRARCLQRQTVTRLPSMYVPPAPCSHWPDSIRWRWCLWAPHLPPHKGNSLSALRCWRGFSVDALFLVEFPSMTHFLRIFFIRSDCRTFYILNSANSLWIFRCQNNFEFLG